jgi:tetratricopeptide (TPR) repeat protein
MDKALRKELKTDELAVATEHGLEYVSQHKQDFTRYGAIAAGVLLVAALGWWYFTNQAEKRHLALAEVLAIKEAIIAPEPGNGAIKAYATEAEKEKALFAAIDRMGSQFGGSDEAYMAEYYRGVTLGDKGDLAGARKAFEACAKNGGQYAALAKQSLAGLEAAEGRLADAEKIYKDLIANPSALVSKDQATLDLARLIKGTRPEEARKLLEPLRGGRGAVARNAVQLLGDPDLAKKK